MYWKPAAARLHAYNSNIKIILLLRDPAERAYSHWRMSIARRQDMLPFREAIRRGRQRVGVISETDDGHRNLSYVERGFYARQIEKLMRFFPREQIFCETSEVLFRQQRQTLTRVLSFLGLPDLAASFVPLHENSSEDRVSPSQLELDDRAYLDRLFAEDVKEVEQILGRPIVEWKEPG